jgi:type I restriction enzyme S subunit
MKQYPVYKDSGLSFIDKVPAHWEVKRAKYFFREIDERSEAGDEELLSVSHITGVTPRSEKNITMFMAESYKGFKLCHPDDLVINIMWAWMGALGVSRHRGIVSSSYGVYRLRDKSCFDSVYLDYLARIPEYVAEYHRRSQGIRSSKLRMYSDDFFQIPIFCPPIDEQRRIVTYINHKLAQIDQFICYKRRFIKLLNEQKTVLINRTVTKGLNSGVPMKLSGIEWIGEMPAHWKANKLKYVVTFIGGGTPSKNNSNFWQGGDIPWVSPKDMKVFLLSNTQEYITHEGLANSSCHLIPVNSLLMVVRSGILKHSLPCAINTRTVTLNQDMKAFLPKANEIQVQYLAHLFTSKQSDLLLVLRKTGTTVESIEYEDLSQLRIPIPPKEEQDNILEFIAQESAKISAAIAQAEKEIELIEEYRTTLISDAVTGKIDVRDTLERGAALVAGGV